MRNYVGALVKQETHFASTYSVDSFRKFLNGSRTIKTKYLASKQNNASWTSPLNLSNISAAVKNYSKIFFLGNLPGWFHQ